jgi:hypothetical protein
MRTTLPPTTAILPARMNLRQLSILAASSSIWAFGAWETLAFLFEEFL